MQLRSFLLSAFLVFSFFLNYSENAQALYKTCAYKVDIESYPVTDGKLTFRERLAVKRIRKALGKKGFHTATADDDKWLTLKIIFTRLDTNTISLDFQSAERVSMNRIAKTSSEDSLRSITRTIINHIPSCNGLFQPFETCPELSPADQRMPLCATLGPATSEISTELFNGGARCQSYSRCVYRIAAIDSTQSVAVWTSDQQPGVYILQASMGRFGRFNFQEAKNFCSSLNSTVPSIATRWSLPTSEDVGFIFQERGAGQATLLIAGHNYWLANENAHNNSEDFSTPIFLMNRLDKTALMQVGTSQSRAVNTVCVGKQ